MQYKDLFEKMPYNLVRTTRRPDAEHSISLRKRRRWYGNEGDDSAQGGAGKANTQGDKGAQGDGSGGDKGGADNKGDDDADDESADWFSKLPPEVQRELKETRREAKNLRKRLRDKEAAEAAAEAARQEAEKKRLEEQGDYKKLYEDMLPSLERLKELEARETARLDALKQSNEARIAKLPEDKRSLVPEGYDPDKLATWLNENESKLAKPAAPNMDGGKQGTTNTVPTRGQLKRVAY